MVNTSAFYDPTTAPYLDPITERRVALITGANSGIGWFNALQLYMHGYVVYIAGRTESKVTKAIEEIKAEAEKRLETEKEKHAFGELHYVYCDLTKLATVKSAAKEFESKEKELHILINNAGLMGVPYEETEDGYEIQYQVNFIAHVLLTLLLQKQLDAAASTGVTPRVVNLLSVGHQFAYKDFEPGFNLNKFPNFMFTWVRYGVAKAANIQYTREYARKHPNILVSAVHPGVILGTELYHYWKNVPLVGYFARASFKLVDVTAGVSVEEGSLATIKAALDPDLKLKTDTGKYYVTGGIERKPSAVARSRTNAKELCAWVVLQLNDKGYEVEL